MNCDLTKLRQNRAAVAFAWMAIALPGVIALFLPWRGQTPEFTFLATMHLLGLGLITLTFALLLKLVALTDSRENFLNRMSYGCFAASIICSSSVGWLKGFEGEAGHLAMRISSALSVGMMVLVVGYLFEFLRTFMAETEAAP